MIADIAIKERVNELLIFCSKKLKHFQKFIEHYKLNLSKLSYTLSYSLTNTDRPYYKYFRFTIHWFSHKKEYTCNYGIYEYSRKEFELSGFDIVQLGFFLGYIRDKYQIASNYPEIILDPDISKISEYYKEYVYDYYSRELWLNAFSGKNGKKYSYWIRRFEGRLKNVSSFNYSR